jgi:UDP-2-acetamido-3-amino-2,3-dideoxy-glucuronate N-acetyltransferase
MIHPLADVLTQKIGKNTSIWQFTVILRDAVIGDHCNINCHVFIENDVVIGNNVTVKSGVYLWDGLSIEDDVFIGPNVTFTNDQRPRSKHYPTNFQRTILKTKCTVGASSVILGGVSIGEYAMIGAASLVTKDVPARALVLGSPAKVVGWLNHDGSKMVFEDGFYKDQAGNKWVVVNNELILKNENPLF